MLTGQVLKMPDHQEDDQQKQHAHQQKVDHCLTGYG
jgi:hypothetical protein